MENTMKGGMILPTLFFLFCISLGVPMASVVPEAKPLSAFTLVANGDFGGVEWM